MGPKHFENKARREWWAVHVEAWQRSGLSQSRYCRQHHLARQVFARWLRVLTDAETLKIRRELAREERRERARRKRLPLSQDVKNRAVRAFWGMHIEALAWSGMTARAYAKALGLSPYSVRRWQGLIDAGEAAEDWRAMLHPSARAMLSTSASSSARESPAESGLTNSQFEERAMPKPRRRSFSAEQKLAIVLETERPGATVSEVARAHQIVTSVLFRWRAELGFGRSEPVKLAAVRIVDEPQNGKRGARTEPAVLPNILPIPPDAVAVELADGRRVFAPAGSDPEVVRRYIDERENGPC